MERKSQDQPQQREQLSAAQIRKKQPKLTKEEKLLREFKVEREKRERKIKQFEEKMGLLNEDEEQKSEEEEDIPLDYICPICLNIMVNPLKTPGCGHVFCQKCLEDLLVEDSRNRCPMCRQEMKIQLYDNYKLYQDNKLQKEILEKFPEQLDYAEKLVQLRNLIDSDMTKLVFTYGHTSRKVKRENMFQKFSYEWKCFVKMQNCPPDRKMSQYVKKVEFNLFNQTVGIKDSRQIVEKGPYQIEKEGKQNFRIVIKIFWQDWIKQKCDFSTIEHQVNFDNENEGHIKFYCKKIQYMPKMPKSLMVQKKQSIVKKKK